MIDKKTGRTIKEGSGYAKTGTWILWQCALEHATNGSLLEAGRELTEDPNLCPYCLSEETHQPEKIFEVEGTYLDALRVLHSVLGYGEYQPQDSEFED